MSIKHIDLQKLNHWSYGNMSYSPENTLLRVAESGWYLKGKETARFEEAYAEYIGTRYCIGCGNGLDALTLIFRAYIEMGVMHEGDEIIVPANTYIASILSITENGLRPVLVEPSLETLQIDENRIEEAITEHTRAILIVHLYGRCSYTSHMNDICQKYGLKLIEDNAQAHGCTFNGRRTGSLGNAAGHSFYPTKNLGALGDAGAITTDDEELAGIIKALGNYGSGQKYVFDYIGRNSRMDELQAAILTDKLAYLDMWNNRRKDIASLYISKVENPLVHIPLSNRDCVWHLFPVLCETRNQLKDHLKACGIETAVHYPIPPHKQKCYSAWNQLSLPLTERIHAEELSIPCNQALSDEECLSIIDAINSFNPT